ncbi:MAG TPA: DUF5049 domain-containing protein [Firmicutes bacterium]|jgi:hypothetical protein|nr:DUF5049 domain-containing protein [Bacillota bacterium]
MVTNKEIIIRQILNIRDSGVTNMLDVRRVKQEADSRGFHELSAYLHGHKEDYWNFIMTGEMNET